ncbi:amino acid transporter AVT1B isoform X2 [Athalia rosae]|uniref:amino acid transporter AVT1B isoform X2 n=1 Tax=Athalia rosae TaxID=37344 RepID=UPI002033E3FF|nr:amino acid transporter AVT1B isoform X2 [Athalia rosae]
MDRERISLLYKQAKSGLSAFFATLCIIDIFGVFPIIALPRAIIQCGWLGIPLVVLVFSLQIYTAGLLGKAWIIATTLDPQIARKNRYPLAAVTELTLGPLARNCVTVLLNLTVFGGGIPSLLVASQNLQLFGLKVSDEEFNLSFCYWLLIVGILLCPIMWLGSPRDMKWLAMCSAGVVLLTAVLTWWCIAADGIITRAKPVPFWPPWERFISGYAILAFQFDVHPTLMTIQVDMQNPKEVNKAVITSFIFTGTLFAVSTGLAAWKYGDNTTANVLQLVPGGYVTRAAILFAALQLCLSSAVGHSALFQHIEDKLRVQRSFGWKRCVTRSALVFLAVALGESVPRFDIVMALIGGSLTGPLVFILPPLMYSRVKKLQAAALRNRTPNVLPASEKRGAAGSTKHAITDPRVHSQSIHYGFMVDYKSDLTSRHSYVYYENGDYSDQTDEEVEDAEHFEPQLVHLDRLVRLYRGNVGCDVNHISDVHKYKEHNQVRRVHTTMYSERLCSCQRPRFSLRIMGMSYLCLLNHFHGKRRAHKHITFDSIYTVIVIKAMMVCQCITISPLYQISQNNDNRQRIFHHIKFISPLQHISVKQNTFRTLCILLVQMSLIFRRIAMSTYCYISSTDCCIDVI